MAFYDVILCVTFSSINQSINLYSPMQLQANNKEVWQAARTGNSPTKLAALRQWPAT